MRRFLKPKRGKKRDISEGEYKRLEQLLHKMAKKQKSALLESAETLKLLETEHREELSVLNACFHNANDMSLLRVASTEARDGWLENFMDVMTPWAEWCERTGTAS